MTLDFFLLLASGSSGLFALPCFVFVPLFFEYSLQASRFVLSLLFVSRFLLSLLFVSRFLLSWLLGFRFLLLWLLAFRFLLLWLLAFALRCVLFVWFIFFFAFFQFLEQNRDLPRVNEEELVPGELVACVVNNELVAVGTVRFVGGKTKLVDGHQDDTHGDVFVQDASRQRQTRKNITRTVKTPTQNTSQSTLSKHIINTHDQHIFSKLLLKTASQNSFSKQLLKH